MLGIDRLNAKKPSGVKSLFTLGKAVDKFHRKVDEKTAEIDAYQKTKPRLFAAYSVSFLACSSMDEEPAWDMMKGRKVPKQLGALVVDGERARKSWRHTARPLFAVTYQNSDRKCYPLGPLILQVEMRQISEPRYEVFELYPANRTTARPGKQLYEDLGTVAERAFFGLDHSEHFDVIALLHFPRVQFVHT